MNDALLAGVLNRDFPPGLLQSLVELPWFRDFEITGYESCEELDGNAQQFQTFEKIRIPSAIILMI